MSTISAISLFKQFFWKNREGKKTTQRKWAVTVVNNFSAEKDASVEISEIYTSDDGILNFAGIRLFVCDAVWI